MKIRNLEIGENQPTRIIAELGTLHLSNYDNMMDAVKRCIVAGADLVKTQLIRTDTAWWASKNQLRRYAGLEWSIAKWTKFFKEANELSETPVFASVFDTCYFCLNELMPAWKIGFRGRLMPELIDQAILSKKPVIISLGDSSDYHSRTLLKSLPEEVLVQFVQPDYPVHQRIMRIPKFLSEKGHYKGLSVHSKDYSAFAAAILLGAQTLEVHVKGDNPDGPDCFFSLSTAELEQLVTLRNHLHSFKLENIFTIRNS